MTYGFKHKREAQSLKGISRERPPRARASERVRIEGRTFVVKTPTDGIPASESGPDKAGAADCALWGIDEDGTLTDLQITRKVYNLEGSVKEGDKFYPASSYGERIVIGKGDAPAGYYHIVRVKITADLYGTNSPAMDWTTAESRSQDLDWSPPETEPTGVTNPMRVDCKADGYIWISYYDYETQDPVTQERAWYVLYSENPKARIIVSRIESETTANKYDTQLTAYYNGVEPHDPLSWEWDFSAGSAYLQPMHPGAFGVPPPEKDHVILQYDRDNNGYLFQGYSAFIARWVKGSVTWTPYDGTGDQAVTISVSEFWEGYNPGSSVPATMPQSQNFTCSVPVTAKVIACWDPAAREYWIVSTDSAWMGPPTQIDVPQGQMRPKESQTTDGEMCYEQDYKPTYGFACQPNTSDPNGNFKQDSLCVNGKQFYDQTNLCEAICNCEQFAYSDQCNECTEDCWWTWSETLGEWQLDSNNCTEPDCNCLDADKPTAPGIEDGQLIIVPCRKAPPECGTCTFTWNDPNWELSESNCTSGCVCPDAPTDPSTGPGDVTRVLDCIQSPQTHCCTDCNGDLIELTNLSMGAGHGTPGPNNPGGDYHGFLQNGPSVTTGDCEWSVPGIQNDYNPDAPYERTSSRQINATVTYVGGSGWTVTIANTPDNNYNQSWSAPSQNCDGPTIGCEICNDNMSSSMTITHQQCPEALGTLFLTRHGEAVPRGCARNDVRALMNRWDLDAVTDAQIRQVARLIGNKRRDMDEATIAQTIRGFLDDCKPKPASPT